VVERDSRPSGLLFAMVVGAAVVVVVAVGLFAWWLPMQEAERQIRSDLADARLATALGEHVDALSATDRILAADPGLREARMIRARSLVWLERGEEAIAEAEAVLKNNPDDWIAHQAIVMASTHGGGYYGGRIDPHIAAVERLSSNTAEAFTLRSMAVDSPKKALALLRLALRQDPDHAGALVARIGRYIELEDYPSALEDADRLLEAHPSDPSADRTRALIQEASGMLGGP
jgi:tetratricopeptide (TPR) repeat protein